MPSRRAVRQDSARGASSCDISGRQQPSSSSLSPACSTLAASQGVELAGGNTLYLNRQEVETMRARFCYAADCRLVAEQMSKVEPARWYCR